MLYLSYKKYLGYQNAQDVCVPVTQLDAHDIAFNNVPYVEISGNKPIGIRYLFIIREKGKAVYNRNTPYGYVIALGGEEENYVGFEFASYSYALIYSASLPSVIKMLEIIKKIVEKTEDYELIDRRLKHYAKSHKDSVERIGLFN